MKNYKIMSLSAALLLTSCASEKLTSISPEMQDSISKLNSKIDNKKMIGHNLLSPNEFNEAKEDKRNAMDAARSGASIGEVESYVNKGMIHINNLERNVELAKVHMNDVLDAREQAFREGASNLETFKDADEELKDLAKNIEEKDINDVLSDKDSVRKMFVKAEIEAIQNRELSVAKTNLDKAEKMDGADAFDKEIEMLEKDINSSKRLISDYKDSPDKYMPSVEKAINQSKRILALASTATWIENSSLRKLAQTIDGDLNSIAYPLMSANPEYMDYKGKVNSIEKQASYVPYLKSELTETQLANISKNYKINNLKDKNDQLNSRITKVENMNKAISSIRNKFSKDEAEVFMQGDKLIIRLVGMGFPIGKATIPSNSKPILDKVADSIKMLNTKDIEIQGHTDATGPASFNDMLSEKRAMAVNSYLVNKTELSNIDAEVKGYGSNSPVALNKSKYGRVQNRRVDIVIDSVETLSE